MGEVCILILKNERMKNNIILSNKNINKPEHEISNLKIDNKCGDVECSYGAVSNYTCQCICMNGAYGDHCQYYTRNARCEKTCNDGYVKKKRIHLSIVIKINYP